MSQKFLEDTSAECNNLIGPKGIFLPPFPITMTCELCAQYERQLRHILAELTETTDLLKDPQVDKIQQFLLAKDLAYLQQQLQAAEIAQDIHRRRRKCASVAVA